MDEAAPDKEELVEGPASPTPDVSSEEEMQDFSGVSDQEKTGESPDFVAVPPYGPGNQPTFSNYADQ